MQGYNIGVNRIFGRFVSVFVYPDTKTEAEKMKVCLYISFF